GLFRVQHGSLRCRQRRAHGTAPENPAERRRPRPGPAPVFAESRRCDGAGGLEAKATKRRMVERAAPAQDRRADAERRTLIETRPVPAMDCPVTAPEQCLHSRFEARVRSRPDAVAASFEDDSLTYAALNARANRLAHRLLARGVGPEQ